MNLEEMCDMMCSNKMPNNKYWRLSKEYTQQDIQQLSKAQISDIVIDIKLALTDTPKGITNKKALELLLAISSKLIRS